jgi:hypothetical protein
MDIKDAGWGKDSVGFGYGLVAGSCGDGNERPVVFMKSTIFWVGTPCSSNRTRRFGEIYHLYF